MSKEQSGEQKGVFRKGLEFFKKIHYGLGAIAFAGAAILNSGGLALFAGYEFAHGFVLGEVDKHLEKRKLNKQARGAGHLALSHA